MRGAILHVVGDLLGSAAAIVAALVILWSGWAIDPLLSQRWPALSCAAPGSSYEVGAHPAEGADHSLDQISPIWWRPFQA